jgi:hypothetical protein
MTRDFRFRAHRFGSASILCTALLALPVPARADYDLAAIERRPAGMDSVLVEPEYPGEPGVGPVPIKIVVYGLRMVPTGSDAEDYSRPGWGGGARITASIGPLARIGAFGLGFEAVNLLSRTLEFRDPRTQLRVEQQTSQNLYRVFLGPEIGAHGHGFFRAYAGADLALSVYSIHTDVVIPDDTDPANEIRQSLDSDGDTSLGYDVYLGADLNFRGFLVDAGVRFPKTFGVPQQLGLGAERIHPGYFQIYLGIGADFSTGAERWLAGLPDSRKLGRRLRAGI